MIKSLFLQFVNLFLIILISILWFNYSYYIPESLYLFSLGGFLMIESYLYIKLPIDFIPDFIPLIGKIDDFLAYLMGLCGFWIIIYVFYYNISESLELLTNAIAYE